MATSTSQKPLKEESNPFCSLPRGERRTSIRLLFRSSPEWFLLTDERRALIRDAGGHLFAEMKDSDLARQVLYGDAIRAKILGLSCTKGQTIAERTARLDIYYERHGAHLRRDLDVIFADVQDPARILDGSGEFARCQFHEGGEFSFLLPITAEGSPLVLGMADLKLRFEFWELFRLSDELDALAHKELANWLMLLILCEARETELASVAEAFKGNFSSRGSDPYYIVSDLISMHRDGMDIRDFLEPVVERFAMRHVDHAAIDIPETFLKYKLKRKIRFAAG